MSVQRWGRSRRKAVLASLMPALIIGIPLAMLLVSQLSSLGRLEDATRLVLTQTAVRVAEELASEVRFELATAYGSRLDGIPASALAEHDLDAIGAVLQRADDAFSTLGSFLIGNGRRESGPSGPAVGESIVFYGPREPWPSHAKSGASVGAARQIGAANFGFSSDPQLAAAIAEHVNDVAASGFREGGGMVSVGERRYLLLLRLSYYDEPGRPLRDFVGFVIPTAELTSRYFGSLATRIRNQRHGISTDQALELSVVDDRGAELFRTGPSLGTHYAHEAPLLLSLLGPGHLVADPDHLAPAVRWGVRSGYPGTDAAALARSSTNQQRQLLFLVSVVAMVGIVMSGRAISRELGVAQMKAEFVSSVSHDLKTPLASIQLLADLLDSSTLPPPPKVHSYGKAIGTEARRLGKLIDGILEFERIDTGGRNYLVESIDLRDPVRRAVGEFATQLRENRFRTELRLPGAPVVFVGNSDALLHAFANLVGNAVKYSGDDRFLGVRLREADGNAVIEVRDHGSGIPASERGKIFDRFYRVPRDAGTAPSGTGLGLPISRHVVSAHGGRISVAGRAGGGAVFTVELPLARPSSSVRTGD